MFRLLLICILLLLLYFGFTIIKDFDSGVLISFYDYNIETSLIFSLISGFLLLIVSFIVIKFLILLIDIPEKIHSIFYKRKINQHKHALVKAFVEFIMGNEAKAASIARNAAPSNEVKEIKEFYTLVLAETEQDISKKIEYFQELIKFKEFTFYSAKKLGKLFYRKDKYSEAVNYAVRAYNLNEFDGNNLVTLVNCYGKLALWEKFLFIVNKLSRVDLQKFLTVATQISYYYLLAAKQAVASNNIADANNYLESAINLNCVNPESLDLYFTLNSNLAHNKKIKILKDSFDSNPTIELIQIFKKFIPMSNEQIYEEFSEKLALKKSLTLAVAIAAYLDLPDKMVTALHNSDE